MAVQETGDAIVGRDHLVNAVAKQKTVIQDGNNGIVPNIAVEVDLNSHLYPTTLSYFR
jgi:hypothetical protein